MERTHAELQKWHHQAVRESPEYRMMGLLDCEAEFQALNTLPAPDLTDLEDRLDNLESISAEKGGIPRRYYDQIQQLRGEIAYLRAKIVEQPPAKGRPSKYQDIKV